MWPFFDQTEHQVNCNQFIIITRNSILFSEFCDDDYGMHHNLEHSMFRSGTHTYIQLLKSSSHWTYVWLVTYRHHHPQQHQPSINIYYNGDDNDGQCKVCKQI